MTLPASHRPATGRHSPDPVRVALLPLDERPVNTRLAVDIGAVAGVEVTLPPTDLLPVMRRPGDTDGLADWLIDTTAATETAAAVVSIDMLVHGGLIASRTSDDSIADVVARTGALRTLRAARPALPVSAVSLVMRASDSYSTDEEPAYWGTVGRQLHRLGADLHEGFLADLGLSGGGPAVDPVEVPEEVRGDFLSRRLRNHIVNLAALDLHHEGVVDPLLITADDTAVRSAGSVEQSWLHHWGRALSPEGTLMMHPGADEVGAILVARALDVLHTDPVAFAVVGGEDEGLTRVAPYENLPVGEGAAGQVRAAGGVLAESATRADAIVVIHPPALGGGDWCGNPPSSSDDEAVDATVTALRQALDTGAEVGLADVRYANGADPVLIEMLREEGLLLELSAYAGWNTAGNSIGSVVAALKATVVGQRRGSFHRGRARRLLLHRLVEDWAYQTVVRTEVTRGHGLGFNIGGLGDRSVVGYTDEVAQRLQAELDRLGCSGATIGGVTLPWRRTFEIDFELSLPEGEANR